MKIVIEFETDNQSFKDNFEYQVRTIFKKVETAITCDNLVAKNINDLNGNKIGSFTVKLDSPTSKEFIGHCPECNNDDLEQIDGTMEYQELKCANGHEFVITSKGWSIE